MKLTHIAQTLTLALLVATTYLAWQAHDESAKANAKMDVFTQQQRAVAAQNMEMQSSAAMLTPAPQSPPPPMVPAPVEKITLPPPAEVPSSRPAGSAPAPAVAATRKPFTSDLGSASVSSPSAPVLPTLPTEVPLTPLQRRVKEAPSLGKIKEFRPDQGFVVLAAGTKQGLKEGLKLDVRRESAVVGRITVSVAEEAEAVADVDFKSVPAGVTIQAGDDLIGIVLPQ